MRRCVRNVNSVTGDDRGPRDQVTIVARVATGEDRPRRECRDVGDMQLYRIEVGRDDGVEVRHIVGAIANEGRHQQPLHRQHPAVCFTPPSNCRKVCRVSAATLYAYRILNKPMNMQLLAMQGRILAVSVVAVVVVRWRTS